MTEKQTRIAGYIRVSKIDEASDGYGLAAQRSAIEKECERRGWVLTEMFSDEGESGKSLDRPALKETIAFVAAGEATGLVVAKLDRLSRSVADFAALLAWFTDSERTLVALDLSIDTSTPGGRLVANVFASLGQWERETIAARTKEGLQAARDAGRPISGESLFDHPDLCEKIKAMRSKGMTLREIAAALNAEGIPTLRGGTTWRPSALQSIIGPPRKSKKRLQIEFPEIIS